MKKFTLLDGGSGTLLWDRAEQCGIKKDPVWIYNIEHPELVEWLAKQYIGAGSEIIFSNTFSANAPTVERVCRYSPEEIVARGVEIAKKAAEGTGVKVFLDVGPLSQLMEPYGDMEEDEAEEIFSRQILPGVKAGADGIMLETFIDLNMLKVAAKVACETGLPVFASMSFEKIGKTMFGSSVKQFVEEMEEFPVKAIGMNCSVGPDAAVDIIKQFAECTSLPVIAKPNAGLPELDANGNVISNYTAEMFVSQLSPALEYASYVGGCCGTTPEYIKQLKQLRGE